MKTWAYILTTIMVITACSKTNDKQAEDMLAEIQSLYDRGYYAETLDSIESLRIRYPKAIDTRKKALRLWQDASLRMAQADIHVTDSALQATLQQIKQAQTLLEANQLRQKRDSLKARFDAMCGVVRMIHQRQGCCHEADSLHK